MKAIKVTVLIIQLLLPHLLSAQTNELDWIYDDERIILFRIAEEEVPQLLYKENIEEAGEMRKFLHNPLGIYKKDESWSLPGTGHYLVAQVLPTGETFYHRQSVPFRVNHFSEYGHLTLQVIDRQGNVSSDAIIHIQSRQDPDLRKQFEYDSATCTYRLAEEKIPEQSLLVICLDGFTAWYNTHKQMPYIRGSYNQRDNPQPPAFYSYMVTDKNLYRPGETVRFKSYALGADHQPLTGPLEVWIKTGYEKEKKITTLLPYRPGGYHGELMLHDTLELTLDREYSIHLKKPNKERVAHTSFRYKDYELRQMSAKASSSLRIQYPYETNRIRMEVTDPNGLPVPGATASLSVTPVKVENIFSQIYLLPDTFLKKEIPLSLSGPTEIEIPGDIFGQTNLTYQVHIEIHTPDSFSQYYSFQTDYRYHQHRIVWETRDEKHRIGYRQEEIPVPVCAILFTDEQEEGTEIELPYMLPIDPQVSSYRVVVPSTGVTQTFDLFGECRLPQIETSFSATGLHVKTSNPEGRDMTWFVYCGETLLYKGIAKDIDDYFFLPHPHTVCYVEASCHIGGKEKKIRQSAIPLSQQLHIFSDLPERVFPGQQVDATLTVQHDSGEPATGVDLTAFATNAMLNYRPSTLPNHQPPPRYRERKHEFDRPNELSGANTSILTVNKAIDKEFWQETIGLDSLEIFNFCHPGKELYSYTLDTPDGSTQFAPFIMHKGYMYYAAVIECDGIPVWFSWTDFPQQYAFPVSPDTTHTITIRQSINHIVLENVRFEAGKKTILSIDLEKNPGVFTKENSRPRVYYYAKLTTEEREKYAPFTTTFRYHKDNISRIHTIRHGDHTYELKKANRNRENYHLCIGPVTAGTAFSKDEPFWLEGGKSYWVTADSIYAETPLPDLYYTDYIGQTSIYGKSYLHALISQFAYPEEEKPEPVVNQPWVYRPSRLVIKESGRKTSLEVTLPEPDQNPGIARYLFFPSGQTPQNFERLRDYHTGNHFLLKSGISPGEYDLFILYNDGSYLFYQHLPLLKHSKTYLHCRIEDLRPADARSKKWGTITAKNRNKYYPPGDPKVLDFEYPVIELLETIENDVAFLISEDNNNKYDQPDNPSARSEDSMAAFYEEVKQLKSLRSNFPDVAFWQPALVTDSLGKARFRITFPDNLTRWNAVIYAMNEEARTGTARTSILSYKPIMAELATPRFLVEGDQTYLTASIRNYTADREITGITLYDSTGDSVQTERIRFGHSFRTHYPLTALPADTASATFRFIREDGYTDGEEQKIPLVIQGTEIKEGYQQLLADGNPLTITGTPGKTYTVQLTNRKLDLCVNAMQYLCRYEYACNEQLASRLKGMLGIRLMKQYLREEFEYDTEVQDMINRLLKNQNRTGLWGWWNNSDETSYWMSAHILEALSMAQQAGYTFTFPRSFQPSEIQLYNMETIFSLPESWLTNRKRSLSQLEEELKEKEKKTPQHSYLKEWLLIWEQRGKEGEKGIAQLLLPYLRTHLDGTVSCQDDKIKQGYWKESPLMTTLIAYRIIRNEPEYAHYVEPMRAFIFRSQPASWNTYQSAQVVTTLLPELIREEEDANTCEVRLSGKEEKVITHFPYELTLAEDEKVQVQKQGSTPVFCSVYSTQHTTAAHTNEHFTLRTYFEKGDTLELGKVAKLLIEIEIKTPDCEYLMVNVPIPAGCSYTPSSFYRYTHREQFKERTTLFFEKLPEGKHQFEIALLPRFTGTYHLNPAKAELMYLPHIHCTNDMRKVIIEE